MSRAHALAVATLPQKHQGKDQAERLRAAPPQQPLQGETVVLADKDAIQTCFDMLAKIMQKVEMLEQRTSQDEANIVQLDKNQQCMKRSMEEHHPAVPAPPQQPEAHAYRVGAMGGQLNKKK